MYGDKERRMTARKISRRAALGLMGGTTIAIAAGCGGGSGGSGGGDGANATASSKKFTEQILLGQMYGLALENAGFNVDYRLDLGSEQVMDQSLIDGTISVYPEYTGTALVAIVEDEEGKRDTPEETYEVVREFYQNRDPQMAMLTPAPFDNNYGIVMRTSLADELGIQNLQDLADNSGELVFSSYSEFQNRSDGFPNMQRNYDDGFQFEDILIVNDLGIRYQALAQEEADVAIGFTTDGQLASPELKVIEDGKAIWPFYYPAPVLMQQFLDDNPDAEPALNEVSASLDADVMREMNGAIDLDQEDYEDVARAHLEDAGIL